MHSFCKETHTLATDTEAAWAEAQQNHTPLTAPPPAHLRVLCFSTGPDSQAHLLVLHCPFLTSASLLPWLSVLPFGKSAPQAPP